MVEVHPWGVQARKWRDGSEMWVFISLVSYFEFYHMHVLPRPRVRRPSSMVYQPQGSNEWLCILIPSTWCQSLRLLVTLLEVLYTSDFPTACLCLLTFFINSFQMLQYECTIYSLPGHWLIWRLKKSTIYFVFKCGTMLLVFHGQGNYTRNFKLKLTLLIYDRNHKI